MSLQWYVLRSKPKKEDVVYQQLRAQEFESYFPRIRVHPKNPRPRKYKPYFPGYMFVRIDLEDVGMSVFKWMPHTLGFVTFDDQPAAVQEHMIRDMQGRIKEINDAGGEVFDGLKAGDAIRIEHGPFSGYEAVFDTRLPGTERVRVLLQLLNDKRMIPMELRTSQIRKMG